MSKPHSMETQPFCSLEDGSYSIISDDYVHEKLFTIKINQKASKGTLKLKNNIVQKGNSLKSSGEIKLWFPFWNNRTLYFKSKNNQVKLHYDHGITKIKENDVNLFWSYQVKKNFQSPILKAGFSVLKDKQNWSSRIRLNPNEFSHNMDAEVAFRGNWTRGKWSFDGYQVWNPKSFVLKRNALQVKYQHNDDNQFYLRGTHDDNRDFKKMNFGSVDSYFTNFFFNYWRKLDNNTSAAIQAQFNKNTVVGASVGVEKKLPQRNASIRVRAESSKNAAFVYQGIIKDYGKFKFGMEATDIGGENKIKYGVQVDLNL